MRTLIALCLVFAVAGLVTAQRIPQVARADLPIGLGIAKVLAKPGMVLRFYNSPSPGSSPDDYPVADVVVFGPGVPSVDIAEAPPWLVPEHLKMDYELFHLRVLTLSAEWVEVIGNSTTAQTWWINRSQVEFADWPEFLLSVSSIEALDAEANPVRLRALDAAPILSTAPAPLPVLAVQGDWLKVATGQLADRMPPEGWIRWRRGARLVVAYNPLS